MPKQLEPSEQALLLAQERRSKLLPDGPVTGACMRLLREATGANTDDMYYILGCQGVLLPVTGMKSEMPLQPGLAILARYLINSPECARLPAMPGFRYPSFDEVFLSAARFFPEAMAGIVGAKEVMLSASILGIICGLRRLAGPEWQRNENKRRAPASKRLLLHILAACNEFGADGLHNYLSCVDSEAYHRGLGGLSGVLKLGHWDRQRFRRLHKERILGS